MSSARQLIEEAHQDDKDWLLSQPSFKLFQVSYTSRFGTDTYLIRSPDETEPTVAQAAMALDLPYEPYRVDEHLHVDEINIIHVSRWPSEEEAQAYLRRTAGIEDEPADPDEEYEEHDIDAEADAWDNEDD